MRRRVSRERGGRCDKYSLYLAVACPCGDALVPESPAFRRAPYRVNCQ